MEWKRCAAALLALSLFTASPAALAAEGPLPETSSAVESAPPREGPAPAEGSGPAADTPPAESGLHTEAEPPVPGAPEAPEESAAPEGPAESPEESIPEEGSLPGGTLPSGEPEKAAESIAGSVGDLLETQEHGAYLTGYRDGTFHPAGQITRAEAAQLFYNLLRAEPELTADFSDIGTDRWYTRPVRALASLGAILGYSDGTFRPEENITRAEFVTIASRFSTLLEGEVRFSDVSGTSWARNYIASACAHGWVSGYPDGTFRPNGNITRSEAVQVLNSMLGRSPDAYVSAIYYTVEFDDVARTHWAYAQICEAATPHGYTVEAGAERWTLPDRYDGTGWALSEGLVRYEDPEGGWLKGFEPVGGYTYYFDPDTGELQTGWQTIGGSHYLLPGMDQAEEALRVDELLTATNFTASNRTFGDIEYITVHYTATPNDTALGECQYFQKEYRGASAGYFVDENSIWRCVADRDVSWHCGNDVYYHDECRNYNSIGIEMCSRKTDSANASSPYDPDWYFAQGTIDRTAALVRELMMKYGVPLEHVIRHNDVSHKTCPAPFVNDFSAWQDFLTLVSQEQTDYTGAYEAEVTAGALNVRTGPGKSYEIAAELKKGDRVTVLEETGTDADSEGRWVRTGQGWISYPYLCRLG